MPGPLSPRDAAILGSTLGFVAGFADASTFVGADGVFCAHVTGNFVVLAADLALHAGADEWLKLATFPIFVVAVAGSAWAYRRFHPRLGAAMARHLLAVKAALIAAAAVVGLTLPSGSSGAGRTAIVALLVIAMGIQNAIHRLDAAPLGAMTTVMTGNVTQLLTESIILGPKRDRAKHRLLGLILAGFTLGCACGAWGVARFGFGVLAVPAAIVLVARSRMR
jgi:uncharacterized membrane protein YoaK (UPF0700 family)